MTTFATLQADVKDAMGRTDIPSYVYRLTQAGINRDLRILEMQSETTLTASGEIVSLPSDFLEAESLYIDSGGSRTRLVPITEMSQAVRHNSSGRPYYYAVHDGEITLSPVPDGSYTITLRYYARLANFSADGDTNDILTRYPGLYLYGALTHAAVWAKDTESAQTYNAAYTNELDRLKKADVKRRHRGPIIQRSAVVS